MPRPELVKLLDKITRGGSAAAHASAASSSGMSLSLSSSSRDVPCLMWAARKGAMDKDGIQVGDHPPPMVVSGGQLAIRQPVAHLHNTQFCHGKFMSLSRPRMPAELPLEITLLVPVWDWL
jgi:hypothetical protein